MLRAIWSFFLTGLFLGYGPCLLSCGPLLVSYIAAAKENGPKGLTTYIIFSATRVFVYFVFGILVGLFGEWILHRFFESFALSVIFFLFGVFLLILGAILMSEKTPIAKKCDVFFHRYMEPKGIKNVIIFGLIVSFSPCVPLLAVLGYIALLSDTWIKGAAYMTAFGLGTVVSPLIILSITAGWVANILSRHEKIMRIVRLFCGLVICSLGINLILISMK
jgi:sulfite exporter TauE/SafE